MVSRWSLACPRLPHNHAAGSPGLHTSGHTLESVTTPASLVPCVRARSDVRHSSPVITQSWPFSRSNTPGFNDATGTATGTPTLKAPYSPFGLLPRLACLRPLRPSSSPSASVTSRT